MKYDNIKSIVGFAGNISISSENFRYSELFALAQKVGACESGSLTIIIKQATLRDTEIEALAKVGGKYIRLDLSDL